jgi:hypothetical protein
VTHENDATTSEISPYLTRYRGGPIATVPRLCWRSRGRPLRCWPDRGTARTLFRRSTCQGGRMRLLPEAAVQMGRRRRS